MGGSRDETVGIVAALAAVVFVLVLVLAGGSGQAPRQAEAAPTIMTGPPACAEWTDGCVTCRRTPDGPACSLPGIACLRSELRCLTPGR